MGFFSGSLYFYKRIKFSSETLSRDFSPIAHCLEQCHLDHFELQGRLGKWAPGQRNEINLIDFDQARPQFYLKATGCSLNKAGDQQSLPWDQCSGNAKQKSFYTWFKQKLWLAQVCETGFGWEFNPKFFGYPYGFQTECFRVST